MADETKGGATQEQTQEQKGAPTEEKKVAEANIQEAMEDMLGEFGLVDEQANKQAGGQEEKTQEAGNEQKQEQTEDVQETKGQEGDEAGGDKGEKQQEEGEAQEEQTPPLKWEEIPEEERRQLTEAVAKEMTSKGALPVYDENGQPILSFPLDSRIEIKVDGEKKQLPLSKVIEEIQKHEAATKRLNEASLLKQQLEKQVEEFERSLTAQAQAYAQKAPPDELKDFFVKQGVIMSEDDADGINFEKLYHTLAAVTIAVEQKVKQDMLKEYEEKSAKAAAFFENGLSKSVKEAYDKKLKEDFSTLLGENELTALLSAEVSRLLTEEGLIKEGEALPDISYEVFTRLADKAADNISAKLKALREPAEKELQDAVDKLRKDPDFRKEVAKEVLAEEQNKKSKIPPGPEGQSNQPENASGSEEAHIREAFDEVLDQWGLG